MSVIFAKKSSTAAQNDSLRSIETLCGMLMAHNGVVEYLVHTADAQPPSLLDAQIRQLQAHTAALRRLCEARW